MTFLFVVLFLFVAFLVFITSSGWTSLARYHSILFAFLFIGYAIFGDPETLGFAGIIWLLFSCISMVIGERIGEAFSQERVPKAAYVNSSFYSKPNRNIVLLARPFLPKFSWIFLTVSILAAFIGNYLEMRMYGFGLSSFFSASKFFEMNNVIAADRYGGNPKSSTVVTLLTSFRYIAALCSGYSFLYTKLKRGKALCIIGLLPALFNVLIDNTKAGFIACIILAFAGLLVGFLSISHRDPDVKTWQLIIVFAVVVVFLAALFLFMVNRVGYFNQTSIEVARKRFLEYAFNEIKTFDFWLSDYYVFGNYSYGMSTFTAPFSLLGLTSRVQGVYGYLPGMNTNVYTGYRGVIEDFGVLGGQIFVMLVGFIGGTSSMNIKIGHHIGFSKILYSSAIFFVFFSAFVSPWVYTSYWFTFVFFALFIAISEREAEQHFQI